MTLRKFEQQLKKLDPRLRIRQRGWGDIVGVFYGQSYICRLTKGELQFNGYRFQMIDPQNKMNYVNGLISKRGRKTVTNILRNYRWTKNHRQHSSLLWGYSRGA